MVPEGSAMFAVAEDTGAHSLRQHVPAYVSIRQHTWRHMWFQKVVPSLR